MTDTLAVAVCVLVTLCVTHCVCVWVGPVSVYVTPPCTVTVVEVLLEVALVVVVDELVVVVVVGEVVVPGDTHGRVYILTRSMRLPRERECIV